MPVLEVPKGEEGGHRGLQNLLKEEEEEEEEEEEKNCDDEEEREGKRRDEEDMQDSLVVEEGMIVKFSFVSFATCLLPMHLMLQGSFHQEEVKQSNRRDTQKPNTINYLTPPESPDHMALCILPCLPEQCNHCGKNF